MKQQPGAKKNYIKPIQLGALTLESNLVQAPLAGFSCAPMRVLAHQQGAPGFCSTEMLSANKLIRQGPQKQRYLYKSPEEGLLSVQLAGKEPDVLAKAVEVAEKTGADLIDLNCGCPVKKIRKKGMGSRLIEQPELIHQLVCAMRKATNKPLSIKIRVGVSPTKHHVQAAQAAEQAGADFIVVHGRDWQQRYDVGSNMDAIREVVSSVSIPVIGNGDVVDYASAEALFETTGCAGIMVARASVGQPWLFRSLLDEQNGLTPYRPTPEEVGPMLLWHAQALVRLDGEMSAMLQTRKLAKYYARDLVKDKPKFLEKIVHIERFSELQILVEEHF